MSLILFTLVIKLILLPFQMKSKKSMVRMSRMSGKMQEIQKKYANNQLKMQEEMQKAPQAAAHGIEALFLVELCLLYTSRCV